jgi:Do/DeqQ family serine protease
MRNLWLIFAQAATVAVGALFVLTTLKPEWLGRFPSGPQVVELRQATGVVPARATSYSDAVRKAVPAVVSIFTSKEIKSRRHPFLDDPLFRHFFGDQLEEEPQRAANLGSGVIVSPKGYILTSNHVVEAADEIEVALADGRILKAKAVGSDPETDLAVLQIGGVALPAITFGDADALRVGDVVLAIGNPFRVGQTVTMGIVSALGRKIGLNAFENFIQTDAAINPGNSGGALINTRGELVGINTGIFSQSGGYQGIGFAVPSNLAKHVIDDLLKYGEVRRGSIDFRVDTMTSDLAEQIGTTTAHGAVVTQMYRSSPSYDAGLRPGDVVVAFNGQGVDDASQLRRMVADAKIGTAATLKIIRSGRTVEMRIPIQSSASTAQRRRR